MDKWLVLREKGNVIVSILYNRNNNKYQFVNLTDGHICACVFDTVDDALQDMLNKIDKNEIIDAIKYDPDYDPDELTGSFKVPKGNCCHVNHVLVSNVKNVITCENYCKWYHLYYIDDNGTVHPLDKIYPDAWDIDYRDHSWRPRSVVEFAIKNNLKIGFHSYIAMVCMYNEAVYHELCDYDLPTKEDLDKVIVPDNGDFMNCRFDEDILISAKLYKYGKG